MVDKFKSLLANDSLFTAVLLVLVGVTSFGLGRLSILESASQQNTTATINELPPLNSQNNAINKPIIIVVASKSGTKYHLPDCPGALQMKPENKIQFPSREEAEAAGYRPAANCPGL